MPAPPKGGAFLWWRYSFRLKYKAAYPRVTPSVIACGDATLPLLSLRDIFPRPGEVGPQGDG